MLLDNTSLEAEAAGLEAEADALSESIDQAIRSNQMELVQEGSESRIKADVYQTTNENSRYLILSTCHPTVPEKRCLLICVLSSIASTEYTGDGITPEDIPK